MKLLIKLNVIFLAVFALGLAATAYVSQKFLQHTAREHVIQNARIMMETAMSMRSYTSLQIAPLLKAQSKELQEVTVDMASSFESKEAVSDEKELAGLQAAKKRALEIAAKKTQHLTEDVFHPQLVPAFGATEAFNYLRQKYPEYTYKEATLNPTNPRDRATDWEADIVEQFRHNDQLPEFIGQRDAATGQTLYLARPIRVEKQSCLECHSTPEAAPVSMIKLYGPANGFGWKLNEVIGAQIVSVPMALPLHLADEAFRATLVSLVSVFAVTLLVLNLAIYLTVIRPVTALTEMAEKISKGQTDLPELPVKGNDEITQLSAAFNRMHRSLAKALRMLDP